MHFLVIILAILLPACDAEITDKPMQWLKVNWAHLEGSNPFSTEITMYEVWRNSKLVETTETTSYLLAVDSNSEESVCVQIRIVRGALLSDFSDQSCYHPSS